MNESTRGVARTAQIIRSADSAIIKGLEAAAVKVGGTGLQLYEASYVDLVLTAESDAGTVALVAGSHTRNFAYWGTEPWDNVLLLVGDAGYTFTGRTQGESLHLDFDVDSETPSGAIRFKGKMQRATDGASVDVDLEIAVTLKKFPSRDLGAICGFVEVDGTLGMRWAPYDLRGDTGRLVVEGRNATLSKARGGCECGHLTNLRASEFEIKYDYVAVARPGDDGYGIIDFASHALNSQGALGYAIDTHLQRTASAMVTIDQTGLHDGNPHQVYSPPQDDPKVVLFETSVDLGPAKLRRQMIRTTDGAGRSLWGLREIFERTAGNLPPRRSFHMNVAQVNLFLFALVILDVVLSTVAIWFPETWSQNFHGMPYVDPAGLLRRTGAVWVAFALLQAIAIFRWQKDTWWLPLIAGVRFTELFSDWMTIAVAEKMTTIGTLELLVSPPGNLVFGLILIGTYKRLQRGPLPKGSVFAKPWY